MSVVTGLSGNELFCLEKKGYAPGNIVVGNSVHALAIINDEAKAMGADDVIGVKTYVYQLGNGLIEFLAIGTAVKKIAGVKTESAQLPVQAIVVDKDTFYDSGKSIGLAVNINSGSKPANKFSLIGTIVIILIRPFNREVQHMPKT